MDSRFNNTLSSGINLIAAATSIVITTNLLGIWHIDTWYFFCGILIMFYMMEYLPDLTKPGLKPVQKAISMIIMCVSISPLIYLSLFGNIGRIRRTFGAVFAELDIVFGVIAILATMWWVKRRFGWAMPVIASGFIAYVLFRHMLPDPLGGSIIRHQRFISFVFSEAALYGSLLMTAVRLIFPFMLFGAFLTYSGVGNYMLNASLVVAGKYRGGPAKVAVISSALLGTIAASATANVATTGPITIPLMKKTGYSGHFAAAVEAVASSGGQLSPPIMGAAAFIMAEFLGVPYSTIVLAAVIPATLYYLAVFLQVDLMAVKMGLKGVEPEDIPDKRLILRNLHMLAPLIAIIIFLMVIRMSPTRAGLLAVGVCVLTSWTTKESKMGPMTIYSALVDGARSSVAIISVLMLGSVITGAIGISGLAVSFSGLIMTLSGESMLITAILTAIICLILGMGLPTSAAYIITSAIAASALIRLGVMPLAAHFFVFYYAVLATITPPVATASFTAASIAGSPPMKTCLEGTKLGVIAYLMPFFFINNPAILLQGTTSQIIISFATAVLGTFLLAITIVGVTLTARKLELVLRLIWGAAALALLDPGSATDLIGIVLFGVGCAYIFLGKKLHQSSEQLCGKGSDVSKD